MSDDLATRIVPLQATADVALELHEERLAVARRRVAGQTVRVATTTHVRDEQVEAALEHETIDIERVAVGRVVDVAPEIRHEGDVTIVPVMEEVIVVERRLVLKEEVRIRVIRTAQVHRETVQLRAQTAAVTRSEPGQTNAADTSSPLPQLET